MVKVHTESCLLRYSTVINTEFCILRSISKVGKSLHESEKDFSRNYLSWTLDLISWHFFRVRHFEASPRRLDFVCNFIKRPQFIFEIFLFPFWTWLILSP